MVTVCTGFSQSGYRLYGERFLESFDRHWPRSVDLKVYTEERTEVPRGECRSLFDIPGCAAFLDRHRGNVAANGREPRPGWSAKDRRAGYCYRFDAWKFCRMAMIPRDAARDLGDGILVWLDADVMTYRDVPEGFVEGLIGDADVAYLGRVPKHSETGFIAFRLPEARRLIDAYADLYASDTVFDLLEWHSAYAFDQARGATGITGRDLTPSGRGHVWFQSPLGQYMDHLKGARKTIGASRERPAA